MMRQSVIMILPLLLFRSGQGLSQDTLRVRATLRAVAGAVLHDASFGFLDAKEGRHYASPAGAPPGADLRLESRYNDWRYWNGVLDIGMLAAGHALNDTAIAAFSRDQVAFCFDNYRYFQGRYAGQGKWEYPFAQRFIMEELDDCGAMGSAVIEVYRRDPRGEYRTYIDSAASFMRAKLSRLEDGTFVRSFPRKWTLWADDLYMSVSFLSRMGELSGDSRFFDDAALQVARFHRYLFDESKGLMHHCWYSDTRQGGIAFWGRGNGWALLAQVDLLDRLPEKHPQRPALLKLLRKHIEGIARYQSDEGLWHQLLDRTDAYLETSCSAMFTYAVAHAVRKGYIDPRFDSVARRGWKGVLTRISADGQVAGVCAGTTAGDDLEFYESRPTPPNDPHGTGAVLLAGSEMLNQFSLPASKSSN